MLPEHYCDYLIALYTEGEDEHIVMAKNRNRPFHWETVFNFMLAVFIIAALVLIYFTELSFLMQTTILSFFVIILIFMMLYYRRKHKNGLLLYITTAFLALLYSVEINETFFLNDIISLYIILFVNIAVWIAVGLWRKLPFFIIAGCISAIFLLVYIFM